MQRQQPQLPETDQRMSDWDQTIGSLLTFGWFSFRMTSKFVFLIISDDF